VSAARHGVGRRRLFMLVPLVAAGLVAPALPSGGSTWVSPAVTNGAAIAAPVCPTGSACVTIDATKALGPVDLVAQGLLFGVDSSSDPAIVNALRPTSWRVSGPGPTFTAARSSGAAVTDILSNLWYDTHGGAHPTAPWQNWSAYDTWLRQTVTAAVQSGQLPDYWEIQNEPDGWYQSIPPETTAQALHQYGLAATIIRSIDPTAKIEGPSLLGFFDTPGQPTLDMKSFLDYVSVNHLPLDAISWHEVIGSAVAHNPSVVIAHVAAARGLLSHYPSLAHLPVFINEYSGNDSHLIPGWAVGWIAAIEQAGVAEATRACWHEPDYLGQPIAECNEGGLDGLLQPGSGLPQDLYWVHWIYAQMTGTRIWTASSDRDISAYATYDAASGKIQVLLGRHASCTAAVRTDCTQPASATPSPKRVTVQVKTPRGWVEALVSSGRIANTPGPMLAPSPSVDGVFPASQVTVDVGGPSAVADGDAYGLTITNV
jgi:hypothetical protein